MNKTQYNEFPKTEGLSRRAIIQLYFRSDLKYPAKENAVIWGVCMVVWGFRWVSGWSQMVEIEVGDTLKLS